MVQLSVIVPVYEQWDRADALLAALQSQSVPADQFEIIAVDNGSSRFQPPLHTAANFTVLRCNHPGSYAARNAGAAQARAQWLVFTDADCLPATDWLAALQAAAVRYGPETLLAGRVEMTNSGPRASPWEIYDTIKGIPQARYVRRGYGATANFAVSRQVFDRVGGFDPARRSGGDAAFCRKAAELGHPLRYVPEAVVAHPARETWAELATKARRVKGGQMVAGTPLRYTLGSLLPPLPAIARLLTARKHPLRHRMVASAVQLVLWGVELREVVRLLAGGQPERR